MNYWFEGLHEVSRLSLRQAKLELRTEELGLGCRVQIFGIT
jgi:hypothetical protein